MRNSQLIFLMAVQCHVHQLYTIIPVISQIFSRETINRRRGRYHKNASVKVPLRNVTGNKVTLFR